MTRYSMTSDGKPSCPVCAAHGIETVTDGDRDGEANARLISAAPDLYAVAERIAEHFAYTDAPLGIAARAALAKARGEVQP